MSTDKRDDGLPVIPLPSRDGRKTQRQPRLVPSYELPVPPYPKGRVPWIIATSISQCGTPKEILEVAYDGISAHQELCEKCVLHRNINWWNLLRIVWSRYDTLDRAEVRRNPNIRFVLTGDADATPSALLIDIDQAVVRHNHPMAALIIPRAREGDNGGDNMADILSGAFSTIMSGLGVARDREGEGEGSSSDEGTVAGPSIAEVNSRPSSPMQDLEAA
ncbi:hypothetical protein AURDEDRAFT_181000 [Auricularia subglabra TFB-10046 SS5]|nr:hypothetical protein AURDEDRAFT_181000 [Auricularia subglabra TFB-10046 SS5]